MLVNFSLYKEQTTLWDPADKSYQSKDKTKEGKTKLLYQPLSAAHCSKGWSCEHKNNGRFFWDKNRSSVFSFKSHHIFMHIVLCCMQCITVVIHHICSRFCLTFLLPIKSQQEMIGKRSILLEHRFLKVAYRIWHWTASKHWIYSRALRSYWMNEI